MTTTDTLRGVIRDLEAKARELELDKKLTSFADQADHFLRVAATRAGEYAAENRDRVEATLDKAGATVDEKTEGKYHAYVGKVRAGVLSGVDWVVEQRETAPGDATTTAGAAAAGDGTPTAGEPAAAPGAAASAETATDSWADVADTPDTHHPRTEGPTDAR
ncbi:hypothetical protein GCM10023168_06360 [Fodinibacter luteus]|uniref:Uncharacterized protein n=1 Tax=Fodinibacter luteus TaxID=552064 RepID=A0ABP8K1S8_9MICO